MRTFKPGYSLRASGHSKMTLIGPDGEPVRDADGRPVLMATTPTFHAHYKRRLIRQFRQLGVIE